MVDEFKEYRMAFIDTNGEKNYSAWMGFDLAYFTKWQIVLRRDEIGGRTFEIESRKFENSETTTE